ncbi:lipocalin / cytosolic fatty-acid binding protein, partial [Oesophagostomum dentatum]
MSFEGKWVLDKSENFDEYMKEVGVGLITRTAAAHLKVNLEIKKEGDKWIFLQTSTFKNSTLEFKLGEEFEETTADGRKFKAKIEMVDGKLVHTQTPIKVCFSYCRTKFRRWKRNTLRCLRS